MILLDVELALALCSHIAGVWIALSSAERLIVLREFRPCGLYDARVNFAAVPRSLHSVFDLLKGSVRLHACLLLCRLASGLVLMLSPDTLLIMTVAWAVVAATTLLTGWLLMNGGEDGSHQMLTIVSVALSIGLLLGFAQGVPEMALYFVGAQACLAYGTAGVAKLISPIWRSGEAIRGVLLTRTYGIAGPAILMQKQPVLALAVCWGTITFEVAFIFAPAMPQSLLLSLFLIATVFHLVCAYVMGLNGFLWSFAATYPAIMFLNQSVATRLWK